MEEEDVKVKSEEAKDQKSHICEEDSLKDVKIDKGDEFTFGRFDVNSSF